MNITQNPHKLHILVCTNARHDGTPSCGDSGEAQRIFETLKRKLKEAKLPVRVSRTGCLGPCAQGPNVMCYAGQSGSPKPGMWLQGVGEGDIPEIEAKVRGMMAEAGSAGI